MAIHLTGNKRKVYDYIKQISPEWATIADIEVGADVHPHQQVYIKCQELLADKFIEGVQGRVREREWSFRVPPDQPPVGGDKPPLTFDIELPRRGGQPPPPLKATFTSVDFERLAQKVLSQNFRVALRHRSLPGIPKDFDLVSDDGCFVGDAKYFTMVRGKQRPPAKFATIAEHVWLLEKTQARHCFLVFGNQREVPVLWLRKCGHLVRMVEFYFLADDGKLENLKRLD